jgi:hypothetical protein
MFQNQRTVDLLLRNKSKLENCRFGLFGYIKEPAVAMKELAKNQQLEKLFFLSSKKLRTKVLHQNPILDPFSPQCVYTQVVISKVL